MREWRFGALLALLLGVMLLMPVGGVFAQEAEQADEEGQEPTNIEEVVVVTASRSEQLLLEAPTAISVIDSADIALSPAQNYADLLRGVPGLNISQTSARDINMSSRSTVTTLDASQLVLIDGRSVYQDFFGFVAWDLLPIDFSEIEQIEVIRGPGSAVWGANAMSGVVNIITKTPRSMGNAFRLRAGAGERSTGFGSLTYSGVRDRWSYRLTAGYLTQDPWDRPGPLPNGTPRDNFANTGTKQPKFDARIDYDLDDRSFLSFFGGVAGTGGVIHTGIGPFQIQNGTTFWYGRADYNRDNLNVKAYLNALDGDGINLLNGLNFIFKSKTYDISATNTSYFGRHAATYGANYRGIDFDLSIAPGEDSRSEGGGFVNFDLNFNDYFSLDAGVRVDKFSILDDVVVSPRGALLVRPAATSNHVLRAGFGRAFRAPSMINNFLDVTIFNQVQLPVVGTYVFPSRAVGNPDLSEERLDQIEVGYRGALFDGRLSWDIAVYRTETKDSIDFYTSGVYTAFNPPNGLCGTPVGLVPCGWPLPPVFLPPFGPVLIPSEFSYRNIGEQVNKGVEVGLRIQPIARNTLVVNYSYQANPQVSDDIDPASVGIPAKNRVNVGWNGFLNRLYYAAALNYVGEAYWTDVLDSRYYGTTDAYTTVDASLGYMFLDGAAEASLRATNLFNEPVLQHVYGDVIGRRIVLELSLNVR
jgi:outer membrane receptor protein involved in Fe transport